LNTTFRLIIPITGKVNGMMPETTNKYLLIKMTKLSYVIAYAVISNTAAKHINTINETLLDFLCFISALLIALATARTIVSVGMQESIVSVFNSS